MFYLITAMLLKKRTTLHLIIIRTVSSVPKFNITQLFCTKMLKSQGEKKNQNLIIANLTLPNL